MVIEVKRVHAMYFYVHNLTFLNSSLLRSLHCKLSLVLNELLKVLLYSTLIQLNHVGIEHFSDSLPTTNLNTYLLGLNRI